MNRILNVIPFILVLTVSSVCLQNNTTLSLKSSRIEEECGGRRVRSFSRFSILEDSFEEGPKLPNVYKHTQQFNPNFGIKPRETERLGRIKAKAVLLCGGLGNRFNYDFSEYPEGMYYIPEGVPRAKQFVHIHNIPVFVYSLAELIHSQNVSEVVIVARPSWYNQIVEMILRSRDFISNYGEKTVIPGYRVDLIDNYSFDRVYMFAYDLQERDFVLDLKDIEDSEERYKFIKFSESGPERCYSTYNALRYLEDFTDWEEIVLIHDGARPLLRFIDLENLVQVASKYGAAVPGFLSPDTVKLVRNDKVSKTLDRSKTFIIQTPQAFKFGLVKNAYKNVLDSDPFSFDPKLFNYFTDDSSFLESQFTNQIKIVDGHKFNIKLSYNGDLDLCRLLLMHTLFSNDFV